MKYKIEISKCNLEELKRIDANPDWYARGGSFMSAGKRIVETHGFTEIDSCFDHEAIARVACRECKDFEYEVKGSEWGDRIMASAEKNIKH